MAFLNIKYDFVVQEDDCNDKNPKVKLPDMERSIEGVAVNFDKSDRITIYNNEIEEIATTSRNISWSASTGLEFVRPDENDPAKVRLMYTGVGTAPLFRTNRGIGGGADTVVEIERVTAYVARLKVVSGTAMDFTNVQVNDFLKILSTDDIIDSPFTPDMVKEYLVQSKGVDYIDFIDNSTLQPAQYTLGNDFAACIKVLTRGPVKKDDTLEISGASINPSNHGRFLIIDSSDDYVEIYNDLAVEESFLKGTNIIVAYEHLIGFVHIRSTAPFKIRFGEQQEWVAIEKCGPQTIFMGSVSTHKIQAFNDGLEPVSISIQSMMVVGQQ